MKTIYNPKGIEQSIYTVWEKNGYFKPNNIKNKESFCIMMPPPNITGNLHLGHAFQLTIIDIIVRYQRMLGKNTLWVGGTDHAGIATQIVVERNIATQKNKTRCHYSRDAFINEVWKWKKKSTNIITQQMRRLGISVDWERERFTMDELFCHAVRESFIRLYKENLIYKNKRLVYWNSKLRTVISDLEVENRKTKGFIWYIRYFLENKKDNQKNKNYLVVATTRPETLIGDTAIAVHPEDARYKNFIGQFAIVPIVHRRIPIISDKYVDMKKNTGCVKITPAHDFNDYEIACRHQLPIINILTFDGNIRESAEIFDIKGNKSNIYSTEIPINLQKLTLSSARKIVIDSIDNLNLLEKVEPYDVMIPYSERENIVVEPMLTDQWYIHTKLLAEPAIKAVKNGDIQFVPKQYKNMYLSWMTNIKDWCISRQLWWGHRIPAWYDEKGNIYVGHNEKEIRKQYNLLDNVRLLQDEDVLDTWFSSALWTFAALGWPKNTDLLHQFHPTNVIVSGFDIIFFWIIRMIMITMHFIKDDNGQSQIPFRTVYITGLMRDEDGQKMSKSKGNIIDPIDMIDGISLEKLLRKRTTNMMKSCFIEVISKRTEKQFPNGIEGHSADALRFTLASLASSSRDINWDMNRLRGYRNFCNKLWNASRFILNNTEGKDCGFNSGKKFLSLSDRWILSELQTIIKSCRESLDSFRFDITANTLYQFIRNQLCDWYLELTKSTINNGLEAELRGTRNTLLVVFELVLRLAHPIIPFITEYIWQRVKVIMGIHADTIMLQPFPKFNTVLIDQEASDQIELLKKIVMEIRNIRVEMNIPPKKPLQLFLRKLNNPTICHLNKDFLKKNVNLDSIKVLAINEKIPISVTKIVENDVEILIPIEGLIDKSIELQRLERKIIKLEENIHRIESKLDDKTFIFHAVESVINKERENLAILVKRKQKLVEYKLIISKLESIK